MKRRMFGVFTWKQPFLKMLAGLSESAMPRLELSLMQGLPDYRILIVESFFEHKCSLNLDDNIEHIRLSKNSI